MDKEETLKLLSDQLDGLAKSVASDENFRTNRDDYNVTINSLRKRIVEAKKMTGEPSTEDPMTGTKTGRMSSKNPNFGSIPKTPSSFKKFRPTSAKLPQAKPKPVTDRRGAIEHTRKLNERGNNS